MHAKALVVLFAAAAPYYTATAFASPSFVPRSWRRDQVQSQYHGKASSYAGSTTSAIFPPPNALNANPTFNSYFPPASVVGYAGPTPTGDEAAELATATIAPKVSSAGPLLNPSTFNGDKQSTFDVLRTWGNLSPMFSIESQGLPESSALIPQGCEITQVHLVHRHGARYPTSGSSPSALAAKLHAAATNGSFTATGNLEFLNTWTYKLGAELLTPFGRQQMYDLGVAFRIEYGELLKGFTELPVFRTTSESRMVQSAENFAAGFFGVPDYTTDYRQVITVEAGGFNNTLAPYETCNNSNVRAISSLGGVAVQEWVNVYLQDALNRLAPQIQGVNLTVGDVYAMQTACAYETVALGYSAFCDLFTEEEFEQFEYSFDLIFWYGYGPGNPTTAAQGIGYVQELISRLTQTPITHHNSSTNSTITSSNVTFPLNQPIYVDAAHDTVISSIIVALNFTTLNANGPLPTDHMPSDQTYFANEIVPFGSQLVGQVLSCPASSWTASSSSPSPSTSGKPTHIRWLLNDAVVPLSGIRGCPAAEPNGLCPLDTFIAAMQTRLGEVDFAFDCFANYTVPSGPDVDNIVNGRPVV